MFPLNDDSAHLASEGDGPQRDDEEQVGDVRLDTLPVEYLTLTRTEQEKVRQVFDNFFDNDHLLAGLVDDLLEQVWELLDDGDRLTGGEAHSIHRCRRVVG